MGIGHRVGENSHVVKMYLILKSFSKLTYMFVKNLLHNYDVHEVLHIKIMKSLVARVRSLCPLLKLWPFSLNVLNLSKSPSLLSYLFEKTYMHDIVNFVVPKTGDQTLGRGKYGRIVKIYQILKNLLPTSTYEGC